MKKIANCMGQQLTHVCQHATQIKQLDKQLNHYLPAHLRQHCAVANFVKGTLSLSVTNSSLATELRYFLPELRNTLRKKEQLYALSSIKIIINTHNVEATELKPNKPIASSTKASQALLAESQGFDEDMKKALNRLADSIKNRLSAS